MGERNIKELTELSKRINAEAVILFGSRARGDSLEESDYDLLIVDKRFKGMNVFERIISVNDAIGWYGIEPIVFTPEEFEGKFTSYSPLALDPVYEGKAIVNDSFLKNYKKKLTNMIKSGQLKRYRGTWKFTS